MLHLVQSYGTHENPSPETAARKGKTAAETAYITYNCNVIFYSNNEAVTNHQLYKVTNMGLSGLCQSEAFRGCYFFIDEA